MSIFTYSIFWISVFTHAHKILRHNNLSETWKIIWSSGLKTSKIYHTFVNLYTDLETVPHGRYLLILVFYITFSVLNLCLSLFKFEFRSDFWCDVKLLDPTVHICCLNISAFFFHQIFLKLLYGKFRKMCCSYAARRINKCSQSYRRTLEAAGDGHGLIL